MRDGLVEAMAEEIGEWRQEGATKNEELALAALDAAIEHLSEHADEWVDLAGKEVGFYPHRYVMEGLLAVLREGS